MKNMCEVAERLVNSGISQGVDKGQAELAEAIRLLKNGYTNDELKAQGFDDKTIALAMSCL